MTSTPSETSRRVALVANTSFYIGPPLARELARRGHDLVITSSAGNKVLPAAPQYSALRAGATHLVTNVATDVARHGVQVNALGTNFMDFDGFIAANNADTPDGLAKVVARVPMGRLGSVDECAALSCADLDGTCDFVAGQFMAHDGGWS